MKLFFRRTLPLILLLSTPAMAEVYKWTDSNGQVHWGDQPPSLTDSEQKIIPNSYAGSPKEAAPSEVDEPVEERRIVALPPQDPAKCKLAKASQKLLKSGVRLRTTSASGEVGFMSDKEIASQLDIAKQTIAIHCD